MIASRIKSTLRLLPHPALAGFLAMTTHAGIAVIANEVKQSRAILFYQELPTSFWRMK